MEPTYDALRADAEFALLKAKQALDKELSEYPVPISGCDAQFNHYLAERQRLTSALRHLRANVFIPTPRTPMPASGVETR